MFNLGAFAGGLAEGVRSGGEMDLKRRLAEQATRADERAAEIHHARMDKAVFNKDERDRLRAANDEIAGGWREAPVVTSPGQSGSGSDEAAKTAPISEQPDGPFSGAGVQSTISATRAENGFAANIGSAGLMSQYKNPITQKRPDQASMAADEMIGRRMLTGNLLEDANELTRMAGIYKKYGLLKEMAPWMNKAYEAKKKRIPDALHFLLTGDAKAAREILKKGGINLVDDPAPTDANDPRSTWRFNFENGAEQDVNLKELAVRFFPSSTLPQ